MLTPLSETKMSGQAGIWAENSIRARRMAHARLFPAANMLWQISPSDRAGLAACLQENDDAAPPPPGGRFAHYDASKQVRTALVLPVSILGSPGPESSRRYRTRPLFWEESNPRIRFICNNPATSLRPKKSSNPRHTM